MIDKDDVRLLYQVLSSQIEFSKTQQWTMAYYTLLFIGGLVGFSKLIYDECRSTNPPVLANGDIYDVPLRIAVILFVLAVVVCPVAIACVQRLKKNSESMRKCRKHYQIMWPHLSWPFKDSECEARLVGEDEVSNSEVYRLPLYDGIFWFPPMFLTCCAGVFSYGYLLARLWKTAKVGVLWIVLNFVFASILSLVIHCIYSRWKTILERKARGQKKETKDTSLRSIFRRIRLVVRWICTGQMPPCAHSYLHALVINWICKGQDPTKTSHSNDS